MTRERKKFWVITEQYEVKHLEGLACENNPDNWYFPEVRMSLTIGYHIFDTKEEAIEKAMEQVQTEIDKLEKALWTLEQAEKSLEKMQE